MAKQTVGQKTRREELLDWLQTLTPVEEARKELEAAAGELDRDPEFVREFCIAMFVNDMHRAMERTGLSQAEVAKAAKMDRQQINRMLNESGNFTIRTMATVACAIGWRVSLRMVAPDERVLVEGYRLAPVGVEAASEWESTGEHTANHDIELPAPGDTSELAATSGREPPVEAKARTPIKSLPGGRHAERSAA